MARSWPLSRWSASSCCFRAARHGRGARCTAWRPKARWHARSLLPPCCQLTWAPPHSPQRPSGVAASDGGGAVTACTSLLLPLMAGRRLPACRTTWGPPHSHGPGSCPTCTRQATGPSLGMQPQEWQHELSYKIPQSQQDKKMSTNTYDNCGKKNKFMIDTACPPICELRLRSTPWYWQLGTGSAFPQGMPVVCGILGSNLVQPPPTVCL